MSDLDDSVSDMMQELLDSDGSSCTYRRGSTSTTITLRRSVMQSFWQTMNGVDIEIRPVDFLALTTALPYDPPQRGDVIVCDGSTYEVLPTVSEQVYRRISPLVTRIHTKATSG